MNYYDFMDKMDKFCLEYAEKYDFRELTVHTNKIMDKEYLFIKDKNDETIQVYVISDKVK